MKKLVIEIEHLEQRLHSGELKHGESTVLMLKIKRLRKRLNKVSLLNGTACLKDYNTDVTNSMLDD